MPNKMEKSCTEVAKSARSEPETCRLSVPLRLSAAFPGALLGHFAMGRGLTLDDAVSVALAAGDMSVVGQFGFR
jgi:hypothetical protein